MATMVAMVPIASIKRASYNPVGRDEDISRLVKSIEKVGLLTPILLGEGNQLVEGHRRLAAFKKLGYKEIPAIMVKGDPAEIYSHVNSNQKKVSGNQMLQVWVKNKKACSELFCTRMEEAEEFLGMELIKKMAAGGFSYGTYRLAHRIAKMADKETKFFIQKAVKWMMKHATTGITEKVLRSGLPIEKLVVAIERDKTIRQSFAMVN